METKKMQFAKNNNVWIAEVSVDGVFNMHLERISGGMLDIAQRTTTEGKFQYIKLPYDISANTGDVLDMDFDGLVFPKTIRVISYSEVITGTITEI